MHEHRLADPLLDQRLFTMRSFFIPLPLLCLDFFSFAGINYLLPFYLQYVRGFDTSTTGLILTSLSAAMMVAGILAPSFPAVPQILPEQGRSVLGSGIKTCTRSDKCNLHVFIIKNILFHYGYCVEIYVEIFFRVFQQPLRIFPRRYHSVT